MVCRVSNLFVSLGSSLGSQFQSRRSIVARHVQLDQLDIVLAEMSKVGWAEKETHPKLIRDIESFIGEQIVELITGFDAVALVVILGSKDLGDVGKVPRLNIIVSGIPTMNVSLDGITFIANHKSGIYKHVTVKF
jgi:hypothetical protein